MRTKHILFGILALSLFSTSCVRKTEVHNPEPKPDAGKGGLATITVSPQHHSKRIDSCTIYVKYNATTRPSNMVFDDSMKVAPDNGRPLAKFINLKRGEYYFYGLGYDPDIAEPVEGGTNFTVIDTLEATYEIYLAVSEIGGH